MQTEYQDFLQTKKITIEPKGFDAGALSPKLFPWQAQVVRWALKLGRAAIFADCGLGKSFMQISWADEVARHTNQPVIILAPLAVSQQTIREAQKLGVKVRYVKEQDEVTAEDRIVITNYERLDRFDTHHYAGVVLDESSILKSFMGKTKVQLLESFARTQYRLACTATPAPNDHMELGNHAQFLGVLDSNEMLARWFINDTSLFGNYRLKNHAVKDFWDWVCSWAMCIGKPSDLGYSDEGYVLPELRMHTHRVAVDLTVETKGTLFRMPEMSATSLHREKKLTVTDRAKCVADLIATEPDESWLIWCDTNLEADELKAACASLVEVRGDDSQELKEKRLLGFSCGEFKHLLTKAKIAGFGLNWQHCARVAYIGASYSYETFYQTVRRAWRFGQSRPVECHVVIAETENQVWATMMAKAKEHEKMKDEMFEAARRNQHREEEVSLEYNPTHNGTLPRFFKDPTARVLSLGETHAPDWTMYNGDCVDVIRQMPSNSIGHAVYSPPFANLYIYSNSERDMGNCADDAEFMQHYKYMVTELYRCMIPGRIVAVHCKALVDYKNRDGRAGLRDFPGELVRIHEECGFKFHAMTTVWKDPVTEMQRTKAHGLLYKQFCEDTTFSRMGLPDYVLFFRKWAKEGEEIQPVVKKKVGRECPEFPISTWQQWASPVWMTVDQTNVLNGRIATEDQDEKHICPLQLDVIERCVGLYTNPGDVVLSPFAGVGSEGYQSVKMKRKFVGVELKPAYYKHAIRFLKEAGAQGELF